MFGKVLNLARLGSKSSALFNNIPKRNSGTWVYRTVPSKPHRYWYIVAEVAGGSLYWWIFWHLWHDYGHIIGEFDYPDRLKWTDEELGIPPED